MPRLLLHPGFPMGRHHSETNALHVFGFATLLYMQLSACLKRLRDSGRNGLWVLTFRIPIIGIVLMIYFCGIEDNSGKSLSRRPGGSRQFDQSALPGGPTFGRR
ncbi:MAG: DUF805 domain-containing protein [Rhizobiales bacterium]|nr:DUF805 domain-containing protein [Hyphomicrobiales bacterium]